MSKPKTPDLAARMEKHIASPDYKGFPPFADPDTRTPSIPAPTLTSAHDPTLPTNQPPTSPHASVPTAPREPAPTEPRTQEPTSPRASAPTAPSILGSQVPQASDAAGSMQPGTSGVGAPAPTSPHTQSLKAQALDPERWHEATRNAARDIPQEPEPDPHRAYVRASRIGMKRSCTYLHPVCKEQIEAVIYAEGISEEDILRTGLNLFFRSKGLPENAFLGRPARRAIGRESPFKAEEEGADKP